MVDLINIIVTSFSAIDINGLGSPPSQPSPIKGEGALMVDLISIISNYRRYNIEMEGRAMRIFSLILLAALVWTSNLLAAENEWEYIYEGDILPDDPSLGDDAWELKGDNKFAKVTDQNELHIDDVGQNHCFFLYNVADAAVMEQATIEARVKVLSQSGAAEFEVLVGMQDGSHSKWLDLFPDHIKLDSSNMTYDVDMTDYHILRMTRDGQEVTIYLDDNEVIDGPHTGAGESWKGFIFGAGCTLCKSEQYWDYVVFTTEGAFSPDVLPSYASTLSVTSKGKLTECWGRMKSQF